MDKNLEHIINALTGMAQAANKMNSSQGEKVTPEEVFSHLFGATSAGGNGQGAHANRPSVEDIVGAIIKGVASQVASQASEEPVQFEEERLMEQLMSKLVQHGFDVKAVGSSNPFDVLANGELLVTIHLKGNQLHIQEGYDAKEILQSVERPVQLAKQDMKTALTINATPQELLQVTENLKDALQKQIETEAIVNHKEKLVAKIIHLIHT